MVGQTDRGGEGKVPVALPEIPFPAEHRDAEGNPKDENNCIAPTTFSHDDGHYWPETLMAGVAGSPLKARRSVQLFGPNRPLYQLEFTFRRST